MECKIKVTVKALSVRRKQHKTPSIYLKFQFSARIMKEQNRKGTLKKQGKENQRMEEIRTGKGISEEEKLRTRVAVIGIVVEEYDSADPLNEILHQYGPYIIGRMGIPYREKNINIISVAVDAPQNIISAMSGKIGRLPGVTARTAYATV